MDKNLRINYCYSVEFIDDDNVLLASESDNVLLRGKQYCLVLSEIQGRSASREELVEKLKGKCTTLEIYFAIGVLEEKGYLTEECSSLPEEACAYWTNQGINAGTLTDVLQEKGVTVKTLGIDAKDAFMSAFEAIGLKTRETGALDLVVTDDYEQKELRDINREAMANGRPWMLVKPVGVELWLGPIFLPGKTGCWACLKQRLEINRPINAFYRTQKNTDNYLKTPSAYIPISIQIAANKTALEIAKWLYFGKNEELEGKIATFDPKTLTSCSHTLVKRPQCKICGAVRQIKQPEPIVLEKRMSRCETVMGGYREKSAEDTIEEYLHHVSPITGVMPSLRPYYSIDGTPIYNYSSGRNTALRSKTLFWLNQHIRSGNGGKGRTWPQAKAGALCEAIERYSFSYHGDEYHIESSLKKLGEKGIHPNACMNYSENQYRNRDVINRNYSKFYYLVPKPFDETQNMHWTPVYSLTQKTFKYLPSCFCYAQHPAEDEYNLFAYPDTNGCAAGNSMEEAILQGFLELVERDSVALWWYNMLRKPAVDLQSFEDSYFDRVIDYYQSLDRDICVLDLTSDLQIPAFGAISYRLDEIDQDIIFGFGAHVDARIAVERALVELNQILPVVNTREDRKDRGKYRTQDKDFLDWLNTATLESHPYLTPLSDAPIKKASDYPELCEPNIYDSLMFCMDAAREHGLEILALDMTRPDVVLSVVRVFAPGMRHFWKRLAPGRLYDVPVKMGWLKRQLKEDELNSVALFV